MRFYQILLKAWTTRPWPESTKNHRCGSHNGSAGCLSSCTGLSWQRAELRNNGKILISKRFQNYFKIGDFGDILLKFPLKISNISILSKDLCRGPIIDCRGPRRRYRSPKSLCRSPRNVCRGPKSLCRAVYMNLYMYMYLYMNLNLIMNLFKSAYALISFPNAYKYR